MKGTLGDRAVAAVPCVTVAFAHLCAISAAAHMLEPPAACHAVECLPCALCSGMKAAVMHLQDGRSHSWHSSGCFHMPVALA